MEDILQCAPSIICLGIGKPFSDRTAQIQLALLLELGARLGSAIQAYDPLWDDGDRRVMQMTGVEVLHDNKVGY
jgi:DnaJ family protein A protein 5